MSTKRKPTIHELEEVLRQPDGALKAEVLPNGELRVYTVAGMTTVVAVLAAIHAGLGEIIRILTAAFVPKQLRDVKSNDKGKDHAYRSSTRS